MGIEPTTKLSENANPDMMVVIGGVELPLTVPPTLAPALRGQLSGHLHHKPLSQHFRKFGRPARLITLPTVVRPTSFSDTPGSSASSVVTVAAASTSTESPTPDAKNASPATNIATIGGTIVTTVPDNLT
ncbi:hypothetical protein EV182_008759, partial [Spiromyces aspiralis]